MNKNAIQQPEQHTERQRGSDWLVRWLPRVVTVWLLLIGLLAGVAIWERNFLEKAILGIYWLFVAYGKIAMLFTYLFYPTAFLVCLLLIAPPHIVGIFGFFKSKSMWARHRPSNTQLLVIGRMMLSVFVCIGAMWLGINPFGHIDRHVATLRTNGSAYQLAYMNGLSFGEMGDTPHFVLVKCDVAGIVCGYIDDIPTAYWVFPEVEEKAISLNYDPVTATIQVVEKGATIYTYRP